MKKALVTLGIVIGLAGLALPARAATLVLFNMNDLTGGTATSVTKDRVSGTPTLTITGGSIHIPSYVGTAHVDDDGDAHIAGIAASWDSGVNDAPANTFLLTFSTRHLANMMLRYDYRSTSTGAPSADFAYRVDGIGAFTSVGTDLFNGDSAFHELTRDLSTLSAIQNKAMVELRWTFNPGTGGGTTRIDNLEISGDVIPEPATLALLGISVGLLMALRRRA